MSVSNYARDYGRREATVAVGGHAILEFSGWLWRGEGNRSFHSADAVLRLVIRRGRCLANASQMRKMK